MIQVYTTKTCTYCERTKALLKSLNLEFDEISLEGQDELRDRLSRENRGWRTVPMVFIHGKFIGGYDDVSALHKEGKLVTLAAGSEAASL